MKEQFAARAIEGHEAELVDDQQVEVLHPVSAAGLTHGAKLSFNGEVVYVTSKSAETRVLTSRGESQFISGFAKAPAKYG
jgi:hypothetical protein